MKLGSIKRYLIASFDTKENWVGIIIWASMYRCVTAGVNALYLPLFKTLNR